MYPAGENAMCYFWRKNGQIQNVIRVIRVICNRKKSLNVESSDFTKHGHFCKVSLEITVSKMCLSLVPLQSD